MLKLLIILFTVFLSMAQPSYSSDYIGAHVPNAQKVGEGRLVYLFFNVYDAALFAPKGELKREEPFAIQISYLREISAKKIADRSAVEIRNQGRYSEEQVARWNQEMLEIFPDVSKGVRLTGVYDPKGETIFYKNSEEIGRIQDADFSQAFFDIWLDEKTSSPDLRRKLLGNS
ncbi:MAG: chalcone isomerase family protein [Pseudomonadota bacterium]